MAELESLKWIAEYSITLAILVGILVVLARHFRSTQKDHQSQIEKMDTDHKAEREVLIKMHKEERTELMEEIKRLDSYNREMTKQTYELMSSVSESLKQTAMLSKMDKEELKSMMKSIDEKISPDIKNILSRILMKLGLPQE